MYYTTSTNNPDKTIHPKTVRHVNYTTAQYNKWYKLQ